MASNIDDLDSSWNPRKALRAMQKKRDRQMDRHPLRSSWDDFIISRSDKLEYYIVLKRLGLEETVCIIDGK